MPSGERVVEEFLADLGSLLGGELERLDPQRIPPSGA
jgi:hypothetical protein